MSKRREFDFYPTGDDNGRGAGYLLQRCRKYGLLLPGESVLECCVGTGDISRPLQVAGLQVYTNDIDPRREADFHLDAALQANWRKFPKVDYVATNPPFGKAWPIVAYALEHASLGIIFHLRLSWAEPCKNRHKFHSENCDKLSHIYPPGRISYTGDGNTDNVAGIWFVWGKYQRIMVPFDYPEPVETPGQLNLLEEVGGLTV